MYACPSMRRSGTASAATASTTSRRLVYLRADPALLRARLRGRVERFDANAAFPITEELLARYLENFEPPSGEGEELIVVSDRFR
jgi:hypothetical protein